MANLGEFRLKRDLAREKGELEGQYSKRSAFASWGTTIGSILAGLLTGPAAPVVWAALAAGGGAYLGGHIFKKASKTNLKQGKFFKSERERMTKGVEAQILKSAGTSALLAGGAQYIGKAVAKGDGVKLNVSKGGPSISLDVGKEGIKGAKEGIKGAGEKASFGLKDLFKTGDYGGRTYKDTLFGKAGKAIDIKGSLGWKGGEFIKGRLNEGIQGLKARRLQAGDRLDLIGTDRAKGIDLADMYTEGMNPESTASRLMSRKEKRALNPFSPEWMRALGYANWDDWRNR